jgi:hypothetical protein
MAAKPKLLKDELYTAIETPRGAIAIKPFVHGELFVKVGDVFASDGS